MKGNNHVEKRNNHEGALNAMLVPRILRRSLRGCVLRVGRARLLAFR